MYLQLYVLMHVQKRVTSYISTFRIVVPHFLPSGTHFTHKKCKHFAFANCLHFVLYSFHFRCQDRYKNLFSFTQIWICGGMHMDV